MTEEFTMKCPYCDGKMYWIDLQELVCQTCGGAHEVNWIGVYGDKNKGPRDFTPIEDVSDEWEQKYLNKHD